MVMRKIIPLLLILIVVVSGCLFKPPAEVKFSVDKTLVRPGGTIHVVIFVNNTGKVGLTGATLVLGDDSFQILQEPKFPEILPVGESVQLVWILRAPLKPGVYSLKLSLELTDELKRSWTGFYGQFRITVSSEAGPSDEVEVNVEAPKVIEGGQTADITVIIKNKLDVPIELRDLSFNLFNGMKVVSAGTLPASVDGKDEVRIRYTVRAPYAYREGYISTILKYAISGAEGSTVKSFPLKVVWKPWNQSTEVLKDAYGLKYHWVTDEYIVDGYWMKRYNSTSEFNRTEFRNITLGIIGNSESEPQAAEAIYSWMMRTYSLGDTTSTLEPDKILPQDRISYAEAQILITAMLRSVDIPARVITLSNGTDCTMRPMTEFYTADGWYIVDVRHDFVGSVDEYLASPYFPKVYQLVTRDGFRIVAQAPATLQGHEHVDVTGDFLANLEDRLLKTVTERLKPELRSKLMLVMNNLDENERLYALFIFASAPSEEDLNRVLSDYSTSKIEQDVKTMYEFYKNMTWRDDFTRYWRIFAGEV
ncbi:transglutaminase-like domain-containing protein [Thermococcus sp. ES12]|uniref:transglutaminase-like domain-containing protein n=1 Tax=Thermococcus sp. ES12 TaxID=1638246 RepID=UPI0014319C28|nr:transglutaminase-like domain-containing protein [Thermococcus sp. ES12]NJE77110.1 transglutaminase domain-containing protein [Thermococcus sp. ES12]